MESTVLISPRMLGISTNAAMRGGVTAGAGGDSGRTASGWRAATGGSEGFGRCTPVTVGRNGVTGRRHREDQTRTVATSAAAKPARATRKPVDAGIQRESPV